MVMEADRLPGSDPELESLEKDFKEAFLSAKLSHGWQFVVEAKRMMLPHHGKYVWTVCIAVVMINHNLPDSHPKKTYGCKVFFYEYDKADTNAVILHVLLKHIEEAVNNGLTELWFDGVNWIDGQKKKKRG